jgi:asparagine synthetase A
MGLDIAFSKEKALKAGLEIFNQPNGTPEEIDGARHDPDYQDWLSQTSAVFHVPNADHLVCVDVGDKDLIVRANKWGKPMLL